MQIGSINSNYNNYPNYTNRQKVNFKGEVVNLTDKQFAEKAKTIAQSLVKDRKDAVSNNEKKSILVQASNMIKDKFKIIRDTYSPLVEVELNKPLIFYDHLINVISSSRNCYNDMKNVKGSYDYTRYVTLKDNQYVYWDMMDLDLNDSDVRNQIETGFINDNIILYFEMYNNKKNYIPMSQIKSTDHEFWGNTEVAINDKSIYRKTISELRAVDINDELILEKIALLDKINSWFEEHPELKTKEIEDKLTQANTLRQDIEAKLTHNANMNFEEFNVPTDDLKGFFVSAEDLLPVNSYVCSLKDITDYLIAHIADINEGRIFNEPVTIDGETLLIALANVKFDKDNIDPKYVKLIKNMCKMPFIDYNQKDTMGIPFIAHVLNAQNEILFAAVTKCKNLKYDPSLESDFDNITDPEFKELVLNTPIFENQENSRFETIFRKPNPLYNDPGIDIDPST